MDNRKTKLLFIKRNEPFRVSNRKWLCMFNRSGDVALYKYKISASQSRAARIMMLMAEDYDDDEFWTSIHG